MGTLKRRSRKLKSTTRPADDVSADVASKEQGSQHKKPKKSTSEVPVSVATPSNFAAHQRHGDRRGRDGDSGDDDPAADVLLRALQVRKRYGDCSDMWLHRRLHDDSGFPKPVYLGPVRYWRLSDLLAWEAARAEQPTPEPRILRYHDRALAKLLEKRAERKRRKAEQAETAHEP
jgi:hypothetical protein